MTTVRLPLFPLNSVLFPGLVLPLNIFEERYRAMMRDLLKTPEDEPRRFAVVAIRDGHEVASSAPGMPDPTALPELGPAAGFGPEPADRGPAGPTQLGTARRCNWVISRMTGVLRVP